MLCGVPTAWFGTLVSSIRGYLDCLSPVISSACGAREGLSHMVELMSTAFRRCLGVVGVSSRVFAQLLVDGAMFVSGLFGLCCCVVSADTTSGR